MIPENENKIMNFQFDFRDVFNGIEQGVINKMVNFNYDIIIDKAVNDLKTDIKKKYKLNYGEEYDLVKQVKEEMSNTVAKRIIDEVRKEYSIQFDNYITTQLTYNDKRLKEIENNVTKNLTDKLYRNISNNMENGFNDSIKDYVNNIANKLVSKSFGVDIDLNNSSARSDEITISKKEYKNLLDSDMELDALKALGVDNWEGYDMVGDWLEDNGYTDDEDIDED